MKTLKRTPLCEEHISLKAKMVDFGGWYMPVQYTGIIDEHLTVRNNIGLFDVSHMGAFFISGADSLSLLQKVVPQDISKLKEGKAVYTQLTNQNGGIIDDLIIYNLEKAEGVLDFLLIVNASRIDEDFNWIKTQIDAFGFNVNFINKSDDYSLLAVQGAKSPELLAKFGISIENQPERFAIKKASISSTDVFIARTGYTGEDGFEILIPNKIAVELWNELLDKGAEFGIKPIGLGARDTLRLESAMLLYGQDMDEQATPVEASLGWSVSKNKEADYIGKDVIMEQLAQKNYDKVLIGFKMLDKSIPRHNYEIFNNGVKSGVVTSGGVAPFLGQNIGLGYIDTKMNLQIGQKIDINIREKLHPAEIVKRPFYSKSSK